MSQGLRLVYLEEMVYLLHSDLGGHRLVVQRHALVVEWLRDALINDRLGIL